MAKSITDGKRTLVVSGTGVLRDKEPTNPGTADRFTNFVFDHSSQLPVIPNSFVGRGDGVEVDGYRTTNKGGSAAVADQAFVGGSPDLRSKAVNSKSTKPKKVYY